MNLFGFAARIETVFQIVVLLGAERMNVRVCAVVVGDQQALG